MTEVKIHPIRHEVWKRREKSDNESTYYTIITLYQLKCGKYSVNCQSFGIGPRGGFISTGTMTGFSLEEWKEIQDRVNKKVAELEESSTIPRDF